MSPMNRREAIRESLLDEAQGADCLMVKPAGAYLDILRDIRERSDLPLGAYQVSGEYAMIKFAAQAGAIDEEKVVLESLGAIKRSVNPAPPRWRFAYRGYQTSSPVRCIYRDHHTVARIRRLRRYPGTGANQYL